MTAPRDGDAFFRYTENGQAAHHYLGTPLRRYVANTRQRVYGFESEDLTAIRRISTGSGVSELSASLRHDGSPQSLEDFLAAAVRGATLEYFPSQASPSLSFPCVLVNGPQIAGDRDRWWDRRFESDLVLRRIDGGTWQALLEEPLFYWKAGNAPPGLTFTRSGAVGKYTDSDGVLQDAAANIWRTDWLYLDGGTIPDTPSLLVEAARTNIVSDDDLTNWTDVGTPATPTAATDPAGGSGAWTLADADGAVAEGKYLQADFGGTGVHSAHFTVRENTMPASGNQSLQCYDNTAAAITLGLNISGWTAGAPTVTASVGTYLGKRYVGNGYWTLYGVTISVANTTNRVYIYPAETAAQTGSIDVYRANLFAEAVPLYSILDASETKAVDTWYANYLHLQQPSTLYVKMVEWGTGFDQSADAGVLHLGGATAGADPRLDIVSGAALDGRYAVQFDNGIAAVAATIGGGDAVSYEDTVELLVLQDANEDGAGDIAISQSANGGAITTPVETAGPSGGLNDDLAYNDTRIYLGSGGSTLQGFNPILEVKIAPGIKSMAYMRTL